MAEQDIRNVYVEGLQVREGRDGEPSYLTGYAAVFGQETIIEGPGGRRWRERIAPGAFDDVIKTDDVIAAVNHDAKMVLGRSKRGTLALSVDAHGLRYEVKLPNTSLARDTIENVRLGNYPGSSFKFAVAEGGLTVTDARHRDDPPLVVIERVSKLMDVGPVTFPAYEGTSVMARSVPEVVESAIADAAARADAEARQAAVEARAWLTEARRR